MYRFHHLDYGLGSCMPPPGLLSTPSALSVCEALVSQMKTLLEPKAAASDGYLRFFFFFLLEVDCMKQHPPLYSSKPRSMACALRNVTVLKICQSEVPEDQCSLQTLVTPAAVFESIKEEKRPQRPKFCLFFFF